MQKHTLRGMGSDGLAMYRCRIGVFLLSTVLLSCSVANDADTDEPEATSNVAEMILPYDEAADATQDLAAAISQADSEGKLLLINFGANWCPDCREFERACLDPDIKKLIDRHFVIAKVDIGDWNKNPDIVAAWDNPIEGGIPSVVLATPDRRILFTTKAGQLSKARTMGPESFRRFFQYLESLARNPN